MTKIFEWPKDYQTSRARFIELAIFAGAVMESHEIDALGPSGESLSVDIAALTSSNDERLIILTSGVHGVEGPGTGIVLIHATNPWGFAHIRRVNENNVDLNRNFLDFTAPGASSHPQYAELDPVINPQVAPSIAGEISYWFNAMKQIISNRGVSKLFKPIAEGQYDYPKGVFYGGSTVEQSCLLLQSLVLKYANKVDRISILDVHSGLGPFAVATLIGNVNVVTKEKRLQWLSTHFDNRIILDDQSDNTYNANGSFSQWCRQAFADKHYLFLCIEIGTVNPIKLFSALRRENQAHHWAADNSNIYRKSKRALFKVFAPRNSDWRNRSISEGLKVFEKTLGLTN